ncbi:hypothetical protein [Kosmotoga pacifica]|uniref:hypothetical protein n=1 Tax=Kosmotoga pacifica TaxID=1330330 RepID=UPI002352DFB2|nr:hypothetical protein [Kosmotoga pacifica]
MKKFIQLPFLIYKDTPQWIPPLNSMIKNVIKKGSPFLDVDREFFLVMDGPQPVARAGVFLNSKVLEQVGKRGGFTLFEAFDSDEAVDLLIRRMDRWFKERSILEYLGPDSPTNGDDFKGVLVDNFNDPPYINMNYNMPYYFKLLEKAGFQIFRRYAAFRYDLTKEIPERYVKLIEAAKRRYGIKVVSPDFKNIKKITADILTVIESSIPEDWIGVRPPTYQQMLGIVKELKRFADPDLVALAYHDGKPVGISAAMPNYNEILKELNGKLYPFGWLKFLAEKNRIKSFRLFVVYVAREFQKKGVSFAMHYHIGKNAMKKGYREAEGSIIGFDNKRSFQDAAGAGGEVYKEYDYLIRRL